jgi:hypothetical protein
MGNVARLVAGPIRLAHCHRQAAFPGAVELAEARIAISAGFARDVFLPHNRQRAPTALCGGLDLDHPFQADVKQPNPAARCNQGRA